MIQLHAEGDCVVVSGVAPAGPDGIRDSEMHWVLARDSDAPAAARALLREFERDMGWRTGDAALVVAELVTSSVLHSSAAAERPTRGARLPFALRLAAAPFLPLEPKLGQSACGRARRSPTILRVLW